MQLQLKRLIKDLVYYVLNIDISIQNNIAERSLFTYTVIAIKHFWLIQSLMPTKLVFFWLAQLSQFADPSINRIDCIESKSLFIDPTINSDRIESKNLLISPLINLEHTRNKCFNNNYYKSNSAKSKKVDIKKVERDNSEGLE